MSLSQALADLLSETIHVSLPAFTVELIVSGVTVWLLLGRLFDLDRWLAPRWVVLVGSLLALAAALLEVPGSFLAQAGVEGVSHASGYPRQVFFSGLLIHDPLTVYLRVLLAGCLVLTAWLTAISGLPDQEDGPDFHVLLFGSTLGALLMAQSNHLLMLFLAVEMSSVPGYALAGFQKGRAKSSEAALKYLVYGAGAAGVLLYGTSLLAGVLGTASLPEMTDAANRLLSQEGHPFSHPLGRTFALGAIFVFAGLAFKLALVPFHFWCPDVFEGASAEVAGFLSIVPKAGAFALLIRFAISLFGGNALGMIDLRFACGMGLAAMAAATMTLGNLAAFSQQNVKRLLAYSTIAHAGYLLMGLAAWMVAGQEAGRHGLEGMLYYLAVYLFMNLSAFAIVAFLRNATFSESLENYAGLGILFPVLSAGMVVACMSLVGIWPAGGFIGKFMLFAATWQAGAASAWMWVLLGIAGVNTVWSLFYYFRIIHALYLVPGQGTVVTQAHRGSAAANCYVIAVAIPILGLGIVVEPLSRVAAAVALSLLPS